MIYILNQRLQAQNISAEKSRQVLGDVIRTMYTPVFLEELFKPQEIYTVAATKQIFDKLAHSSIMRLNKTSMDKLYDLMTMGVKYQILACKNPQQYLQVTLNHLDTLIDMVKTEGVSQLIMVAIKKSIETYSKLSNGNWMLLEQELLQFFQGKKIKVSLFLQKNLQTLTGSMILSNRGRLPLGVEIPGQIRYYENGEHILTDDFPLNTHGEVTCSVSQDIMEHGWPVGRNIYQKDSDITMPGGGSKETVTGDKHSSLEEASRAFASRFNGEGTLSSMASPKGGPSSSSAGFKYSTQLSAKAELTLLADLLGVVASTSSGGAKTSGGAEDKLFRINLFPNEGFLAKEAEKSSEDGMNADSDGSHIITIDIDGAAGAKNMTSYLEDLDWVEHDPDAGECKADAKRSGEDGEEEDLLALMDSAK